MTPEINAISTIIVAVTGVAILLAWRFGQTRREALPEAADEDERPIGDRAEPGSPAPAMI